jgi:hypothetical protein
MRRRRALGFSSTIDLLVCLGIMSGLTALAYVNLPITAVTQTGVESKYVADMGNIELGFDSFVSEKGVGPSDPSNYLNALQGAYLFAPVSPFDPTYGLKGYLAYGSGSQNWVCARAAAISNPVMGAITAIAAKMPSGKFFYNAACPAAANGALNVGSTVMLTYYISM